MARLWRVHHPVLPATAGATVELTADEAYHVRRVLRLRVGDAIAVFDAQGSEWRAAIVACDDARVVLHCEAPIGGEVEPPLEVLLFQGLCKPERMDWIVQKATEIGVGAVSLVASERGGARGITDHRLERWRRIALEACKQCGRRRIPRVESTAALPLADPQGPLALLLDPAEGVRSLGEALGAAGDRLRARGAWIAVGPEGGFEPREVLAGEAAGWWRVGLGPRTLRSETAGLVAAAILLHLAGDLGSAR